ncbi:Eco57I restriction-modification methylase [Oribacterium sp. KHPX15]|uniref:BREX-1 system adenine-specific DNA-methyltransferase PglX n=1 Tax=Oribacterium sp. KHPX15 TaxID=1855342 RepID=UPI00089D0FC6|nr:BREX-1 system adenine-specific DNA-methyltransferase PglX [Oribacterium sp. KHPX15]SEA17897.1 Eco57I restriction-modification methylase [Oribacterium sp. KHPX15]
MDKNAIKKYAVWARRELIEKVSQKAWQYGIEEGAKLDPKLDSINGILLSDDEKKQRQALIRKINENGYAQMMEEVAYTWFNRFIALRFMEVNGYLPSHVRVFTDEAGEFNPQIMSEALHLELEGLDMEKVYELKSDNRDDELFKYLLITQCNALSGIFPKMFQKIADYTELLLPDYLLREGSVIEQMVNQKDGIPEADWQDQVQIIGWLYQYYNTEPKDKVFADLKKNVKITKETIPAATQLFTPDWIVHYMVENSLGRLWLEGHPNESLKSEWKYYLDEAEQEPNVQKQLEEIRKEHAGLKPEEIKCIDPSMGSGHILCVLFDTLIKIYEDYGYTARDAAASIVKNNLWGLDIDERAAQLAYFAVMMKARQYDRRFFTRGIQPHVYAIEESNGLKYDGDYGDFLLNKNQQETLTYMFDVFKDAKEFGSILNVEQRDYDDFINAWNLTAEQTMSDVRMMGWHMYAGEKISTLANQAKALSQKYHVVVTNPPYMGAKGMPATLSEYVKKYYPDTKSDLFSCFIEKGNQLICNNGINCMVTMQSWMFIASYEKMRKSILSSFDITNLMHMDNMVMGIAFGTAVTCFRKSHITGYKGTYNHIKLQDIVNEEPEEFPATGNRFNQISSDVFLDIMGCPISYWANDAYLAICKRGYTINSLASPKTGMTTGDNDRFLRLWHEVSASKMDISADSADSALEGGKKWFPYLKGGDFRRWYGNNDYVINWENDGYEIKNNIKPNGLKAASVRSEQLYFKPLISWSAVTSGSFACRYNYGGALFDSGGSSLYIDRYRFYILALLNSKVGQYALSLTNPTINFQPGDIAGIPLCFENIEMVERKAEACVKIAQIDWDSFERSWSFKAHPLVIDRSKEGNNVQIKEKSLKLSEIYKTWSEECDERFYELKNTEEELNRLFIDTYGLCDDVSFEVEEKNITATKANLQRDIKGLISYAVGCMFGRYSLDMFGLVYAGGDWDISKYNSYIPDKDAIIPICDDEYFEDDIVGRFVKFVEVVYGRDALEDNLKFISEALGGSGTSREVIRNYFINDFFTDHVKTYQKRPIYWLFDSGKKNGFKCLVYMHRYKPDTIARIRTDYVHEQQARYRTAIEEIEKRIDSVSSSEKVKLNKKLNTLRDQDEELHVYEEKIHHLADQMISIDLDDGVKHNYALFQDVLAKIK